MDTSMKSWFVRLMLIFPTVFIIASVVLWKQTRNDMEHIHEIKRQLNADLEEAKMKLREDLEKVHHEKRQLRMEIENAQREKKEVKHDLENIHQQKLDIQNEMSVHSQRLVKQVNRIKRDIFSESNRKEMPEATHTNTGLGGAVYVHWGRTMCPSEDTETVYAGVAGGGSHADIGAAVNMICLSKEPTWDKSSTVGEYAIIMGSEYQVAANDIHFGYTNARALHDHNVPCAVCRSVTRTTQIMIPGQNVCTSGWHKEYSGYLMGGHHTHPAATEFNCIDSSPEADPAGYRNEDGYLLYFVKGVCSSLPCPPYIEGKEITCVVCTK